MACVVFVYAAPVPVESTYRADVTPLTAEDLSLSKWLDSVRNNMFCFFGRLKDRFRLLKLSNVVRSPEGVGNLLTCFILHNTLQGFDGLHELEAGVH